MSEAFSSGPAAEQRPLALRGEAPGPRANRRTRWERRFARRLMVSDALVVVFAVAVAHVVRFGFQAPLFVAADRVVPVIAFEIVLAAGWLLALAALRAYDARVISIGTDEYQRVLRAAFVLFAWLCVLAVVLRINPSRVYLALVFVIGVVGTLVSRWLWRQWIARRRSEGRFISRMLVVGGVASATAMSSRLEAETGIGFRVTGVWEPGSSDADRTLEVNGHRVPVLSGQHELLTAIDLARADTVVVTDTEQLGHEGLRELGWTLDGTSVRLMVAPNVVDVAGPRLLMGAVATMPVLHLSEPQYAGANRLGKALFDRAFAALALVAAVPVLLVAAIAIKLTSSGPVLYRQVRLGRDGEPFTVLKLRTMREGAEKELPALMAANDAEPTELFKLAGDPRVTPVGRLLRRYSIDEIPQFFNVLRGEMSVVGPRPNLPSEVAMFDGRARHRLRVRPGITGLWQVSGRSDLNSQDAIRLDLDYVENWTMFRDLQIIWRSLRAVLSADGAY